MAPGLLRPLVVGGERPRDRVEEDVLGQGRVLGWIFRPKRALTLEPKVLPRLDALAQGGTLGDADRWKERDNEVVEILATGERRVRLLRSPPSSALPFSTRSAREDLASVLPGVSVQLVKQVLSDMKTRCHVQLEGRGRVAVWRVVGRSVP